MSYFTARLAEFNAMRAEDLYKAEREFKGVTYIGIAPALRSEKELKPANYQALRPDEFTMLATEFVTSGMVLKDRYTGEGSTFEVYAIDIDPKEPTVVIRANRKQ